MSVSEGLMDFVVTRIIPLLANFYPNWIKVLFEYVENGLDGKARNLWVVLMPDRVVFIDDGHGMVAHMQQEDLGMLELFKDAARKQQLKKDDDIRFIISKVSRSSLEWMMKCIGYSPKLYTPGSGIRGQKGIGSIAFRRIGNRATWETMPSRELTSEIPDLPYLLTPASNQDLDNYRGGYVIDYSTRKLTDPFGNPLVSGTRVEIFDLLDDPKSQLQPAALAEQLQRRFGDDILTKGVKITVVDRMTKEGRETAGGKIYVIDPPEYKGILVANESRGLRGGKALFKVELYYDPEGKGTSAMLRRQGSDVLKLEELPELNIAPFNSKKLSGYAEFPDLPEDESPWNADKTIPLEGPVKRQWIEAMRSIGAEIQSQIRGMEQRAADEQLESLARQLREVALNALREDPLFEGLLHKTLSTADLEVPKVKRPRPVTTPHNRTEVVVRNEHRQGVPGVGVDLTTLAGRPLVYRATGTTGQVSFGELDDGQYAVKLVGLAPGVIAKDRRPLERVFRISAQNTRERISFDLITGVKEPTIKKIKDLKILPHALSDPGMPYSIAYLEEGLLEINTEHPDLRNAIDTGNDAKVVALFADYVASAVVEYTLSQQESSFILLQQTRLFGIFFSRLQETASAKNLKTRRRKS